MRATALILSAALFACATPQPGSQRATTAPTEATTVPDPGGETPRVPVPLDAVDAYVVHVQDGDSLIAEMDGTEERVRLIGVNAPEHDECWGDDARGHLQGVEGTTVRLSFDVEPRDQYGRLLAYVWVDGSLMNAELVAQGSALAQAFEPNTMFQAILDDAERAARGTRLGMWSPTACGDLAPSDVYITHIESNPPGPDDENLLNEYVVIEHLGTSGTYDLAGMTLRDSSTMHRYTFPEGTVIGPGDTVIVTSGCGEDTDGLLHWCADGPVWDNAGDEALLTTELGTVVAHFEYP